jgi:hypothetical protein
MGKGFKVGLQLKGRMLKECLDTAFTSMVWMQCGACLLGTNREI